MKIITCKYNNKEIIAMLHNDGASVYPLSEWGIKCKTMNELIDKYGASPDFYSSKLSPMPKRCLNIEDVELLAPIPVPKQDIICLGINYMAHAEESARYRLETVDKNRDYAVYFSKRVNQAVPHKGTVPLNLNVTQKMDYECELAVIIGKEAENVKAEDANNYIFGYTILNDISARDIQNKHKQWYMGKSLTGYCPMGPCIVTRDEFGTDPVKIISRVNGELRQNSSTDLIIFNVNYVIEELSSYAALKAGTIISMGTPAGVGMGFTPPRFLKSGDVIECEIEKIGKLINYVK